MNPLSPSSNWSPLQRADQLMKGAGIGQQGHGILRENLATYLDQLPGDDLYGRWGSKIARDLQAGYTDDQVVDRLHTLQEGLRELAPLLPTDATLWVAGGISKGRAGAHSDLDCYIDCGGLSPEQAEMVSRLPGWDCNRLTAFTPKVSVDPQDWKVGNHYGVIAKESTLPEVKLPDLDVSFVGRSGGSFDPAQAKLGPEATPFSQHQVMNTDFLLDLFEERFQAKGYQIEFNPARVTANGPVQRPAELEWFPIPR
ncbi:MAG: hypothetical protein U0931_39365 [Vulcanimicrobiota bacterium]